MKILFTREDAYKKIIKFLNDNQYLYTTTVFKTGWLLQI